MHPSPRFTPAFAPCSIAAGLAARAAGVPLDQVLLARRGSRDSAAARALAMYLAHVGLGVPMSQVAMGFNRHRSTVAYACRRIEERREVAGWDRWVDALEQDARSAWGQDVRCALGQDARSAWGEGVRHEA